MGLLHLFFPENDLALARDVASYTAPPAAVKLRRSGAVLGLWYGDEGDEVLDGGINAQWYRRVKDRFGLLPEVYKGSPAGLAPAPWGWSKASRKVFQSLGFKDLPTDTALERIRDLSHRRTAIAIAEALQQKVNTPLAPAAVELRDMEGLRAFVEEHGQTVIKLPWSSSGRGLFLVSTDDLDRQADMLEAAMKRQGSLMGEIKYDKLLDFAMLFTMHGGRCDYNGLSLFRTERLGAYTGNILAPQQELLDIIAGKAEGVEAVRNALPAILEDIIDQDYEGPLGVDMMAVEGCDFSLVPAVELNLRMTMGHVSLRFYEKHIVDGTHGSFSVQNQGAGSDETELKGRRIASGTVSLSPPLSPFSFQVSVDK